MIAIGLGLVYAGYTIGILGYCWVRGYNVPFTALFAQTWPGGAADAGGLIGPAAAADAGGLIGPAKKPA